MLDIYRNYCCQDEGGEEGGAERDGVECFKQEQQHRGEDIGPDTGSDAGSDLAQGQRQDQEQAEEGGREQRQEQRQGQGQRQVQRRPSAVCGHYPPVARFLTVYLEEAHAKDEWYLPLAHNAQTGETRG